MIYETTYYATQEAAQLHGESFVKAWGWGYNPDMRTGYSNGKGQYFCVTSRYKSCD